MPRKHQEEHENHERWLVSYADFITLLFAFFTVLYATSQRDVAKQKEFEQSIRKSFKSFLDFGGVQGGNTAPDENTSLIPPPIDLFPPQSDASELEEVVIKFANKMMSKEEKEAALSGIRHDALGVEISLAGSALFPSGSDQFTNMGLSVLNKVGAILKASGKNLVVQGHTDNQPISNDRFASNWDLSAARATKIVRYLINRHEINPEKMVVVAYGDQRPLTSNSTEAGRSKNRRIEIMMITGKNPF